MTTRLSVFIILLIMMACAGKNVEQNRKERDSIELAFKKKYIEDSIMVAELRAQAEAKVAELKKKFIVTKDEFQNIEFYKHKHWGKYWPEYTTILAGVNSEGYAWLTSNYYNDDWLFHGSVTIKGEDGYIETTQEVPRYDKNNRTEIKDGVFENVTYVNARPLLMYLAIMYDKKIMVRFNGQQYHKDIVLSKADKMALKETYDLATALMALNSK